MDRSWPVLHPKPRPAPAGPRGGPGPFPSPTSQPRTPCTSMRPTRGHAGKSPLTPGGAVSPGETPFQPGVSTSLLVSTTHLGKTPAGQMCRQTPALGVGSADPQHGQPLGGSEQGPRSTHSRTQPCPPRTPPSQVPGRSTTCLLTRPGHTPTPTLRHDHPKPHPPAENQRGVRKLSHPGHTHCHHRLPRAGPRR